jgi:predicted transcriptional regulator YheO
MPEISITINSRKFSSFSDAIKNLTQEASSIYPDARTYEEKYEVFFFLYSAGIMSFRGAVHAICDYLGVTRTCVYNWLRIAEDF